MRKALHAVVAVAVALVVGGAGASAASSGAVRVVQVVSGPLAQFYGYVTPVVIVEPGGQLAYSNIDIVQHDVVQDVGADGIANKKRDPWCKRFKKKECPLFWSARAGLGDTVDVKGLNNLESGSIYSFYCTLHPGMKGKVVVR